MARAAIQLGVRELADAAKVSTNTVTRFERGELLKDRTVEALQAALEAAGVEFIPENGGGPGVRLRKGGKRPDDHPKPAGPATDAVDAMDQVIEGDRVRGTGGRGAPSGKRLASIKETGEEVPQEEWERFEEAGKKPGEAP